MAQQEIQYYKNGYYEVVSQQGDAVLHMHNSKQKFYIDEYAYVAGVGICYIPTKPYKEAMAAQKKNGSFNISNMIYYGDALTKEAFANIVFRKIHEYDMEHLEGKFYQQHYSLQFTPDYAHFIFTLLKGETLEEFFATHGYNFFVQCHHYYMCDKFIGTQMFGNA